MQALNDLVFTSDAKVILCHVFPTPESEMQLPADRPHPESSKSSDFHIEKLLLKYKENLSFNSELELVSGEPAVEIIRLANIYKADLVVIGSRGLVGMKRIVLGSVSTQVVEQANCSVLVVKPTS
ncbi:universal stress protein [Nodularia spumigena]|uniref:universal stress protein n=1 Tax=Nodularia spumigena TaxID=70799 RepID=UPI0008FFA97E|nr:universal stress protein [Nodularia spumigena]MEA5611917.1 universal stress protein [Nodularia spumigena UHCC 0040]